MSFPRDPRGLSRGVLLAVSLVLAASAASAQTAYKPVNEDPEFYVVAPMPRHCLQTYRLFLPPPPAVMPPDGWPVVLDVRLNGFHRSEDTPQIQPETLQARMLEAGIAVVTARVTPSIPETDENWITWCGGAPDIPGHGLFHPPGFVPPDLAAQGIAPYEHPEYHMAEKDCVMLLQHVRYKARQTSDFGDHLDLAMSRLDHRRIGVYGSSASAIALMWAAFGPERNVELPFAGLPGQYAETSRPDLAVLEKGVVWWPMFDPALPFPVSHFGAGGDSELPAATVGDVDPAELAGASAFFYRDPVANASMPLYLAYDEPSLSLKYRMRTNNCGVYPLCFEDQGQEGVAGPNTPAKLHPAWSGYAWLNEHPTDPVRLVVRDAAALAQSKGLPAVPLVGDPTTQTPDEIEQMHHDDIVAWLAQEFDALLDAQPADAWWSLGGALAGSGGVPALAGQGALLPGAQVTVTLTDARPDAPLVGVAGTSNLNQPLSGGVLVPSPDHVLVGILSTDATGAFTADVTWPTGVPSGARTYIQFWIEDPAGPWGWAASNGLELVAP